MTKLKEKLTRINELSEFIKNNNVTRIECNIGQDEINRLNTLQSVLNRISYLNNQLNQLVTDKTNLEQQYAPVLSEYNSINICPYCGNKLHEGKEEAHNE